MKINYYFMVCEALHEKRTRPLYETVIKRIKEDGDDFYLLSGFDSIDDIPVTKVSNFDDYYSCVEKMESIFTHDWDDADWHMICDDDTFIHTPNLKKFIPKLSKDNLRVYHGQSKLGVEHHEWIYGGPGILLNNRTFLAIRDYVSDKGWKHNRDFENHSDVALFRTCRHYNRRHRNDERIFRVCPETMINLDDSYFNENEFIIRDDVVTIHLNGRISVFDTISDKHGMKECPYHYFENKYFNKVTL